MKKRSVVVSVVLLVALLFTMVFAASCGTDKYTVTFDYAGGSGKVQSVEVEAGGLVTAPTQCAKEGYTLGAWKLGDKEWNFESDTVDSDITLTAYWKARTDIPYQIVAYVEYSLGTISYEGKTFLQITEAMVNRFGKTLSYTNGTYNSRWSVATMAIEAAIVCEFLTYEGTYVLDTEHSVVTVEHLPLTGYTFTLYFIKAI